MTYFEYSMEIDKLDIKFNLSIMESDLYQESVSSFFNKLTNAIISYIDDCKKLYRLYNEKKKLNKGLEYVKNLCKHKNIANQVVYIRGYNGKVASPLSIEEEIQILKNLITYAKLKATDKTFSDYLEKYELNKSGWDIFYKVKIKNIPLAFKDMNEELDKSINDLKHTLHELSSYFENASDKKRETEYKYIFKSIIDKIKATIKKDINIIIMNFEVIQYEIGKKFAKLTENTANKLVRKNITDKLIVENSEYIKDIKYGDDTYKIYKTKYNDVSAMIYGGASIYVDNGFFDLPKGYQLAILYHEIGHHQCKHFAPVGFKYGKVNDGYDIPIVDTAKIVKQLKRDYNKFLFQLMYSPFKNSKRYLNGEEFLYLLIEWEADRFAANIIGKNLIRRALASRFSDTLKNYPTSKDQKEEKLNYDFNMDRMRLRTTNI